MCLGIVGSVLTPAPCENDPAMDPLELAGFCAVDFGVAVLELAGLCAVDFGVALDGSFLGCLDTRE